MNSMRPSSSLSAYAIATPLFQRGHGLDPFIDRYGLPHLARGRVLAITSKLFSIASGRLAPRHLARKREWIQKEADFLIGETIHEVILTVKHGVLFPTAGIDESNSETGDFLLLPEDPFGDLKKLHERLASKLGYLDFGLLMTDSRTQPLRVGVTGIALAHYGFCPVRDHRGNPDLFGRELKMTQVNEADPLAAIAVMLMGESNESRPLAIIEAPFLKFQASGSPQEIQIPIHEDLYGSIMIPSPARAAEPLAPRPPRLPSSPLPETSLPETSLPE